MPSTPSDETPEHEEDADIHVGDGVRRTERDHAVDAEHGKQNDDRGEQEDERIGAFGDDVFFQHQLEGVGDRLQQAVRADAHGSEAHLHVGENLALQPVHANDGERDAAEHDKDVDQRPERTAVLARRDLDVLVEVRRDEVGHQRSTSPRTMSSVPITAITSATNWPRHIRSSACRFTNDGGRTRMR